MTERRTGSGGQRRNERHVYVTNHVHRVRKEGKHFVGVLTVYDSAEDAKRDGWDMQHLMTFERSFMYGKEE